MQTSSKDELYRKLARIVGPERVRTDESYLDERSWDALSEDRIHPLKRPETNLPLCVVLPSDTVQVSEIVRLANEEKVPVLPYGGGSGLMGGALSVRAGMVIDLRTMNRILGIVGGEVEPRWFYLGPRPLDGARGDSRGCHFDQ